MSNIDEGILKLLTRFVCFICIVEVSYFQLLHRVKVIEKKDNGLK